MLAQENVHQLVYYEIYHDVMMAIKREKNFKAWKREWKLELIDHNNPNWKDYVKSLTSLGLFALQGHGGQAVDKRKAENYLKSAAEARHARAMFNFARMHKNGPAKEPIFCQKPNFTARMDATLTGHTNYVPNLIALPDGHLASGSWDSTIRVWNTKTGLCVAILEGHVREIQFIVALPNGRLASGSQDKTLRFWDIATGHCYSVQKSSTWVSHFALLPDGRLATNDSTKIRLWDPHTGQCVATLEGGHTTSVNDMVVLSDGRLATTTRDTSPNNICLWDLRTGNCTSTIKTTASGLVALPNDRLVSRFMYDEKIRLWDTSTGRNLAVMEGAGHLFSLVLLPDGRLASGAQDRGIIRLWDLNVGRCVATLEGHMGYVSDLLVMPGGLLASISRDYTIRLWDPATGQALTTIENVGGSLAVLLDGRLASSGAEGDYSIKLWDVGLRPVLAQEAMRVSQKIAAAAPVAHIKQAAVSASIHSDPFAEFDNFFATASTSTATTKASSDWTSDFASMALPLPPAKAITPAFSDLKISSSLTTIPSHALLIQRELGRGGFGVVSEALWQGTRVAIKQLIGQLTAELLNEFRSETEVHARLRHTNIIALYGVCVEPLKYALVMEFMASGSLFDVLKNPTELPWSLRLSLSLDMVSGLLYLHTQNIIHRDLKSLNILVDEHMRAKIADFGLAKIKLTTASMTKGGGGTPHWMAPELFDETVNSKATDVYATGIILWEIAARKLPYEGKNASQIMRTVEKGNRETMPAGTPPPFGLLISRCWAQRAEDRPSIEVVARDIREIQARLPSNASSAKATVDSGYAAFSRR